MKIAVTGGIGSGKSYVCRLLARWGINVYDCDDAAKRLMRTSPQLRQSLTRLIGPATYLPDGSLNRSAVASFLLQSASNAQAIDAIVHPAVAADFEQSGMQWMECAILYESGFHRLVDRVIVVTAPRVVRLRRIISRDGISRYKAQQWMARQQPQREIRKRADYEIINDGMTDIESQINNILLQCKQPF